MSVRRIHFLGDQARGAIRTGQAVGSLAQVAEELVTNSIDGEAQAVLVHCARLTSGIQISCLDNGTGIQGCDIALAGERYATSKGMHSDQMSGSLGFRGEALASIANASKDLSIVSRSCSKSAFARTTASYIGGSLQSLSTSHDEPAKQGSPPVNHEGGPLLGYTTGTRVTAIGLFSSMPVRERNTARMWLASVGEVAGRMERIACARPHVSFTLQADSTDTPAREVLAVLPTYSPFTTAQLILGKMATEYMRCVRADAVLHAKPAVETAAAGLSTKEVDRLCMGGLLGVGASTRSAQLLYVNGRHCRGMSRLLQIAQQAAESYMHQSTDDGQRRLSRQVLRGFDGRGREAKRRRFEVHPVGIATETTLRPKPTARKSSVERREASEIQTTSEVPAAVAQHRRFLAFVLELQCPTWFFDVSLDPEKTEVMFRDEGLVEQLLRDCVRAYFEGRSMPPEVLDRRPGQMSAAAREEAAKRSVRKDVPLVVPGDTGAVGQSVLQSAGEGGVRSTRREKQSRQVVKHPTTALTTDQLPAPRNNTGAAGALGPPLRPHHKRPTGTVLLPRSPVSTHAAFVSFAGRQEARNSTVGSGALLRVLRRTSEMRRAGHMWQGDALRAGLGASQVVVARRSAHDISRDRSFHARKQGPLRPQGIGRALLRARSVARLSGLATLRRRGVKAGAARKNSQYVACSPAQDVAVTRDMLRQCRPIAQLDRKFVLVLVPGTPDARAGRSVPASTDAPEPSARASVEIHREKSVGRRCRRSGLRTPPAASERQQQRIAAGDGKPAPRRVLNRWRSPILVAVDQHAADERIRIELLEQLLRHEVDEAGATALSGAEGQFSGPSGSLLAPSRVLHTQRGETRVLGSAYHPPGTGEHPVSLSAQDARAVEASAPFLHRWGWEFRIGTASEQVASGLPEDAVSSSASAHEGPSQLTLLRSVRVLGRQLGLQDFLAMARGMQYEAQTYLTSGKHDSLAPLGAFRSGRAACSSLQRCLASRACREAIMFYDPLDWGSAARLTKELSSCLLPFQCAHGRPSLVPLARLQILE